MCNSALLMSHRAQEDGRCLLAKARIIGVLGHVAQIVRPNSDPFIIVSWVERSFSCSALILLELFFASKR